MSFVIGLWMQGRGFLGMLGNSLIDLRHWSEDNSKPENNQIFPVILAHHTLGLVNPVPSRLWLSLKPPTDYSQC